MNTKLKKTGLIVLFLAALIAIYSTTKNVIGEPQPRAMDETEVRDVLKEALAKDREAYDQMMQDADRKRK